MPRIPVKGMWGILHLGDSASEDFLANKFVSCLEVLELMRARCIAEFPEHAVTACDSGSGHTMGGTRTSFTVDGIRVEVTNFSRIFTIDNRKRRRIVWIDSGLILPFNAPADSPETAKYVAHLCGLVYNVVACALTQKE